MNVTIRSIADSQLRSYSSIKVIDFVSAAIQLEISLMNASGIPIDISGFSDQMIEINCNITRPKNNVSQILMKSNIDEVNSNYYFQNTGSDVCLYTLNEATNMWVCNNYANARTFIRANEVAQSKTRFSSKITFGYLVGANPENSSNSSNTVSQGIIIIILKLFC